MSKWRAAVAFALFIAGNVSAQNLVPGAIASPPPEPAGATTDPVDTYRSEDIQKVGALTATTLASYVG